MLGLEILAAFCESVIVPKILCSTCVWNVMMPSTWDDGLMLPYVSTLNMIGQKCCVSFKCGISRLLLVSQVYTVR